jgi:hypothetical protein
MSRPPIVIEARGGRLLPGDQWAEEQIAALPDGRYTARLSKQTRAGREEREAHRALWWAGCNMLAENSDSPLLDTQRKVHEFFLTNLGFVRPRFRVGGGFDMVPVSTSEAEMDDDEFAILQEKARAYSIERFGYDIWQSWIDEQEAKS